LMSKLFLFVALSLLACALSEPIPAGSYCGTYSDEIKVSVTVLSPQFIRLNGSAFGTSAGCPREAAEYVAASHKISLPSINTASDCLGTILRSYSIDPAGVSIVYEPTSNTIAVSSGAVAFSLAKCSTQQFWSEARPIKKAVSAHFGVHESATPSGAYCGTY